MTGMKFSAVGTLTGLAALNRRAQMEPTYIVKTLGCKANIYDSQLIEAELQKRGWSPFQPSSNNFAYPQQPPSVCIVNSCTVTDEADRQSRKMAARLGREHPGARIVVTGCAAEVDPERLARSKGIHYVIGNRDKPELVSVILEKLASEKVAWIEGRENAEAEVLGVAEGYTEILSRHPMYREWPVSETFALPPVSQKTRAFLKIQEGCNTFCTYCIIPYGRGPSRSLRPREVVSRVSELVRQGIREVVITGTNIGDYGVDWGTDSAEHSGLVELLEMIFAGTALERLRVSSLDPVEITPALMKLMEREPRLCPHFHVSLQSPHSRILRLMKRKYGFEQVKECLEAIAALRVSQGPVFVGMDVITGFPGETNAEFEWTCEQLSSLPWQRLHVFPYSEREGTPATRLPGAVRQDERIRRARKLGELSLSRLKRHYEGTLAQYQSDGAPIEGVLLEGTSGFTPNYLRLLVQAGEGVTRNAVVTVTPECIVLDQASGEVSLRGRVLRESPARVVTGVDEVRP